MGTFFKTFLICLFLALGYLLYQMLGHESYSPSLNISNTMFKMSNDDNSKLISKENSNIDEIITKEEDYEKSTQIEELKKEEVKSVKKNYTHSCYFFAKNGQMIKINRELSTPPSLDSQIALLLKGPMISESKQGIYSEIPANVDLINTKKVDNKVIINLSSNFANDLGLQSIENRLKQISKTAKLSYPKANIYLYINGKEVEYLGGDGVYVKQPLD